MEWVETTAKTVEEAKNQALDQLGVAEDDAEIVVLDEPRPGLFGRVRGEARVRARVRPTTPRPKLDRRDRKKKDQREVRSGAAGSGPDDDADRDDRSDESGDGTDAARERPARGGRGGRGRGSRSATTARAREATAPAVTDAFDSAFADSTPAAASADGTDAGSTDEDAGEAGTSGSTGPRRRNRGRRGGQRSRGASGAGADGADGSDDDLDVGDDADRGSDRVSDRGSNSDRPVRTGDKEDMVDAAQVGEEARVFVQGVVDAFGLTGTTAVHQDGDDLEITVDGADLGLLVGPRGTTLQALQELTRVAAQRRLGDHDTRLRVDVGGYRVRRREALSRFAHQVAAQVVADGVAKRLEPMSSADRKVIHDALSDFDGVVTRSEGDDPRRCVVIAPAGSDASDASDD